MVRVGRELEVHHGLHCHCFGLPGLRPSGGLVHPREDGGSVGPHAVHHRHCLGRGNRLDTVLIDPHAIALQRVLVLHDRWELLGHVVSADEPHRHRYTAGCSGHRFSFRRRFPHGPPGLGLQLHSERNGAVGHADPEQHGLLHRTGVAHGSVATTPHHHVRVGVRVRGDHIDRRVRREEPESKAPCELGGGRGTCRGNRGGRAARWRSSHGRHERVAAVHDPTVARARSTALLYDTVRSFQREEVRSASFNGMVERYRPVR